MSRHPNTSGVFPINLVEFGINFKGFSYGTLHLQASKCSGGEKIFWDGASGLFSDFPISHRWHGYELLYKLSRLRRTHWDDMARHFLKQSAHWEGNILLFIEFWIQCYNRNRILSSILSKRKLLHADLLNCRPQFTIKGQIRTSRWLLWNWFYLISGYFITGFYCIRYIDLPYNHMALNLEFLQA